MRREPHTKPTSTEKRSILKQLLYYDIFDHVLTREELIKDCSLGKHPNAIFEDLLKHNLIYQLNEYFSVTNNPELAEKRKTGVENTQLSMPGALKMAKLIGKFPFVRAVALSGSISKGYMDSFKDVDYFIITQPKRLWLSRTMLVFYKKVLLLNSFRYFCLNYFIDENNLEMKDKNYFTATEINTLVPVNGNVLFRLFYDSNSWVKNFYKDFPQKQFSEEKELYRSKFKQFIEFCLSNFLGNWLDILSMKFTVFYWKWKYKGVKNYLFKSSFRFRRDEAKYHPGNFQQLILERFDANNKTFENEKNISLDDEN